MTNKDFKEDISEYQYSVNLKYIPEPRTIDDLECGDYLVDGGGGKRKCLGKCGELYAVSNYGKDDENNSGKIHCEGYSGYQLKKAGGNLYQPAEEKETDIDKCIKVVEEFFEGASTEGKYMKASLVKRLKNLKK